MIRPLSMRLLARVLVVAALALLLPTAGQATTRALMDTINGEQPIQLQSAQITSVISGSMAQTTVHMVFFNPNRRALEGNLQFPLLPYQQITSFALDINGQLRPAVPVEKAKGRQVFEQVESRLVDPALLEVTQGNNFKLRVFPIPPGATRTVQLTYSENMARQDHNWIYTLPLGYESGLKQFSWTLNVNGSKTEPSLEAGAREVKFAKIDAGYQLVIDDPQFAQIAQATVLIPSESTPQTFIQAFGADTYFVTEIPVSADRMPRPLPKVVGILWDSSGSGANRQLAAELSMLDGYIKALGDAEIQLTCLRDHAQPTKVFQIRNGNWDELRKTLNQTAYDGASNLGDWKADRSVGEYLMFSDGLNNYGNGTFPTLSKKQRLYTINSAVVADTGWLGAKAEQTGGRMIQVAASASSIALHELLTEGVQVRDIDATGASALQLESAAPQQGWLRIAGKLDSPKAQLSVTVSSNNKIQTLHIPVSAHAPNYPLAAYLWASYRLRVLDADRDMQRAEIRRLGQKFGIPSAETSLIVLDTVEDYVRYDIAPPADYQAAFEQLRKMRLDQSRTQKADHLSSVLKQFEAKVAWWETSFPKVKPHQEILASSGSDTEMQERRNRVTAARNAEMEQRLQSPSPVAAAPMPTPPPAPIVAAVSPISAPRQSTGLQVEVAGIVAAKSATEHAADNGATITLKKWSSTAPYITRMKAASTATIYAVYLDEKPSYGNSSAFFLDAADMLLEKGERDLALRVLSNLAEMDLENRQVLRILGYRLMEMGAAEQAVPIFEKVVRLADDEPQSFRDLGLAYAAEKHYQQAIDQLNEVVSRSWNAKYPDIELISLAELNAIIATQKPENGKFDTSHIDPRLLKNLPLDLRVVMTWDADNSDMDLWVTDPSGEKCYFGNALTQQGGHISHDVTQGYGPEEFSLRIARPGKYKVEANFYGNRQQVIAGATTLQVKLSSNFGTLKEHDQTMTLRLKERGETVFVGEFEIQP